ncbi:hypothetical protein JHK86_040541 [Glycine max]|nr:hypothetical protein JHK86_040541 [Glycine max]
MCVIGATITKLLVDNGWIYDVCPRCNKKVDGEALSFICVSYGNESASTIPSNASQPLLSLIHIYWDPLHQLSATCPCLILNWMTYHLKIYHRYNFPKHINTE